TFSPKESNLELSSVASCSFFAIRQNLLLMSSSNFLLRTLHISSSFFALSLCSRSIHIEESDSRIPS
uniref:Uncharacterized protein n=1 Tax=Triticum urartu TaxID=4572 RepID=A0A8R7UC23_TRIUA